MNRSGRSQHAPAPRFVHRFAVVGAFITLFALAHGQSMLLMQERPVEGAIEIHRSTIQVAALVHREFPGDAVVGRFVRLRSGFGRYDITLATARELVANIEALDEVRSAIVAFEREYPENVSVAEAWFPVHASSVEGAGPVTGLLVSSSGFVVPFAPLFSPVGLLALAEAVRESEGRRYLEELGERLRAAIQHLDTIE